MQVANCEACVFGEEPEERQETVVRCKRYAPAPTTMHEVPCWRTVDKFQWCGDFRPKDGEAFRFPTEEMVTDGADGPRQDLLNPTAIKEAQSKNDDIWAASTSIEPAITLEEESRRTRALARQAWPKTSPMPNWAHEPGCALRSYNRNDPDLLGGRPIPPPPCSCDVIIAEGSE